MNKNMPIVGLVKNPNPAMPIQIPANIAEKNIFK